MQPVQWESGCVDEWINFGYSQIFKEAFSVKSDKGKPHFI